MTADFVCVYCLYERHVECEDQACACCYGEPAEPPQHLVVICADTYPAAKAFADRRGWNPQNWIWPSRPDRLRGRAIQRHIILDSFYRRRDAAEILALVDQAERRYSRPASETPAESLT